MPPAAGPAACGLSANMTFSFSHQRNGRFPPGRETAVSVLYLQAFAPAVTARMIGGFTVLRLSGLVGTLGENKLTKETLLSLNARLNTVARV